MIQKSISSSAKLLKLQITNAVNKNNIKILLDILKQDKDHANLIINSKGQTALHLCCKKGFIRGIEVLLEKGADPNIKDKEYQTPIHYALECKDEYTDVIEKLLAQSEKLDVTALRTYTTLDLSNRELREIPPWVVKFTDLKYLNVASNNLDSLPSFIGHLRSLRSVDIRGNPLSTIPKEILKDHSSLMQYLRDIGESSVNWSQIKLLVVGKSNSGKSQLIRRLLGKKMMKQPSFTNGISINTLNVSKIFRHSLQFRIYDFGGLEIFYPIHQFFLSGRGIYLVVFSCVDSELISNIKYWIKSIKVLGDVLSTVILIGTHRDKCSAPRLEKIESEVEKLQQEFYNISCFIPVSNITGDGVSATKKKLVEVALKQGLIRNQVPSSYITVNKKLNENTRAFMNWKEFLVFCGKDKTQEKSVLIMTQFLNDVGSLIWLNEPNLRHIVVLKPQWLADVMSSVVFPETKYEDAGILEHEELKNIWSSFPSRFHSSLLRLLEKFEIVYPLPDKHKSIVPSLLKKSCKDPVSIRERYGSEMTGLDDICRFERVYDISFMPVGFFSRLIVRILQISKDFECVDLWTNGIILNRVEHEAAILYDKTNFVLRLITQSPTSKKTRRKKFFILLIECVDRLLDQFHCSEGLVRRLVTANGPYSNDIFLKKRIELPYENVLDAFLNGLPTVKVQSSFDIPIEEIAPDICKNHLPLIDNIIIQDQPVNSKKASVYKGKVDNDIHVAVKEIDNLPGVKLFDMTAFRRFNQQIFVLSRLKHPNLVKLYGIAVNPLRLVHEFIEGKSLSFFLYSEYITDDIFNWGLRKRIIFDICTALDHLANLDPPIIHRDLRSPNVFLCSLSECCKGVVAKVGDYGLTVHTSESIERLKTWRFIAPEILSELIPNQNSSSEEELGAIPLTNHSSNGNKIKVFDEHFYDLPSDVYSFGILMYEIASREEPYSQYLLKQKTALLEEEVVDEDILKKYEANGWKIVDSIRYKEFFDWKELSLSIINGLRPQIPKFTPTDIKELIQSCLEKDPKARPDIRSIFKSLKAKIKDLGMELLGLEDSGRIQLKESSDMPTGLEQLVYMENKLELATVSCCFALGNQSRTLWVGLKNGEIALIDVKNYGIDYLDAHQEQVHDLLFLEPEQQMWCACEDKTISIFDAKSGKVLKRLREHTHPVTSLIVEYRDLGYDNAFVWSGDSGGVLMAYKRSTVGFVSGMKKITRIELKQKDPIYCMASVRTEEGRFIWVGSSEDILVVDSESYTEINRLKAHTGKINDLLFLNHEVWSGGDDYLIIWNMKFQKLKQIRHSVLCLSLVNIPSGHTHVWVGSSDKFISVWDFDTKKCIQQMKGHDSGVACVCVAQELGKIFSGSLGSEKMVRFWRYDKATWSVTPRGVVGIPKRKYSKKVKKEKKKHEENRIDRLGLEPVNLVSESFVLQEDRRKSLIESLPEFELFMNDLEGGNSGLKMITILGPQQPILDPPEEVISKSELSAISISTYPQLEGSDMREGDPICDSYMLEVYSNGVILAALADGCGWGIRPKDAAITAKTSFISYLAENLNKMKTVQLTGKYLLEGLFRGHNAIVAQHPGEIWKCGTTTLLGGVLNRVEDTDNMWVFTFIGIGDCKVFHVSINSQDGKRVFSVKDATAGNRTNLTSASDCGGRIGPHKNGVADLRNLTLYHQPCSMGDYIIMVSDGVHDNLDAQKLGIKPGDLDDRLIDKTWNELKESPEAFLAKENYMNQTLTQILQKAGSIGASEMVRAIIDYVRGITDASRLWMEKNPKKKLPSDYIKFPGKLDHTTCVCFEVGTKFYNPDKISPLNLTPVVPVKLKHSSLKRFNSAPYRKKDNKKFFTGSGVLMAASENNASTQSKGTILKQNLKASKSSNSNNSNSSSDDSK